MPTKRKIITRAHPGANRRRLRADMNLVEEFVSYNVVLGRYITYYVVHRSRRFEAGKGWVAEKLYRQRGKWAQPFTHVGMAGLALVGLMLAPVIASGYSNLFPDADQSIDLSTSNTTLLAFESQGMSTLISEKPRADVIEYTVQSGDTVGAIAEKFGVEEDTIIWENDLASAKSIKPGQTLRILPVSGIRHKVKKGETVYSIAKKYESEPQAIVDYPFNSFVNDETFALAIGQELIVPGGIKPKSKTLTTATKSVARGAIQTPDAGVVAGSGNFVWPAGGRITQGYFWYHQAIDIANRSAPNVLAADSGKVIIAGWPDRSGYGNRVIIDHGNGYATLYAHLQAIYVTPGQYVNRGEPLGKMGSTGRSTGTHLHFEIRRNGAKLNPLQFLK